MGVLTCTERVVVTSTGCCASEVPNERGREVRSGIGRFNLLADGQYSERSPNCINTTSHTHTHNRTLYFALGRVHHSNKT